MGDLDETAEGDAPAEDRGESADKFYRGKIFKVSRGAQRGTVRSASGRNITFIFQHLTMLGPHCHFDDLQEGVEVGFDVSWTSKGLRVSVIRIPD